MNYIFLDIETVPLEITHDDVKNYLMDKKISKEKRSMDANYAKIIVIGLKILNNDEIKLFSSNDEKELLQNFWNFLRDNTPFTVVTHNGYRFDIPFIVLRSCINKVDITFQINTNQWSMEKSNHFDTMIFFSHYGAFTNPNLEILNKLHSLDVSSEKRITGADVERLYKEGKIEEIKKHCGQDIRLLEQIFGKLCLDYLKRVRI